MHAWQLCQYQQTGKLTVKDLLVLQNSIFHQLQKSITFPFNKLYYKPTMKVRLKLQVRIFFDSEQMLVPKNPRLCGSSVAHFFA